MAETPLEMARRHVAEGAVRVQRQRELLAKLRTDGHPVEEAAALLETMLATQRIGEEHLRRLSEPNA